jgi:predicted GNAT family N-acyltransferase
MTEDNLYRMLQLVEEVFATKNDPSQLNVDEDVMTRLQLIHPACLSEQRNDNGPIAWVLLIPTSLELMHQFVQRKINEQELFHQTIPGDSYEAIYLCSALVLPEYRKQGIAGRLIHNAIATIQIDHPIQALCVWPFSEEGETLANIISKKTGLNLHKRLLEN